MKRSFLLATALGGLILLPLPAGAAGKAVPQAEYRDLVHECRTLLGQRYTNTTKAKKLATRLRDIGSVTFPDGSSLPIETKSEADALDAITSSTPDPKVESRFAVLEEQICDRKGITPKQDPQALATTILSATEFNNVKPKDEKEWGWDDVRWPSWFRPIGRWFTSVFKTIGKTMSKSLDGFFRGIGKFFRWLFKSMPQGKFGKFGGFAGPARAVQLTIYFLATVFAVVAIYFLARYMVDIQERKSGRRKSMGLMGGDLDLSEEGITDPLGTAKERAANGDYRAAIRLTYIAALWRLGDSGLLTLEKNRTNWEYQRSLRKRSRQVHDDLIPATRLFDRVWYGKQSGTQAEYETVTAIYEKLPAEFATPSQTGTTTGTPTEAKPV